MAQSTAPAGKGGKADAKKDSKPKAAGGKGGTPLDDKNAPRAITVDYPTNVECEAEFHVIERSLNHKRTDLSAKTAPKSARDLIKQAGAEDKKNPWGGFSEKLNDKGKQLVCKYQVLKGSQLILAIKVSLNKPHSFHDEPTQPSPEEQVKSAMENQSTKKKK
mmetsp:Transcript_17877/g.30380  ORF Transcript_17877/g.30380 Transcript_17877/m.30380 type:complete len:162 (+) Transcript_17877:1714-2199(+)